MHRFAFACLFVCTALLFGSGPAAGLSLAFQCVSNNDEDNCDVGEAQLAAELAEGPAAGQIQFTFTNTGSAASSITDIYFDDGTLLAIASILNGTDVDFEEDSSPGNLPDGDELTPEFEADFEAEADSTSDGVNPGEFITIIFDLDGAFTLADTEAAIDDGSLRVGLKVKGFDCEEDDFSTEGNDEHCRKCKKGKESFVNVSVVPEPTLALLLGAPLLTLALRSRRR